MRKNASNPSTILQDKKEADILEPSAQIFKNVDGRVFEIYPMPDGKLIRCGEAISKIAEVVGGLAEISESGVGGLKMATYLPEFIKALIPSSSKLIAAALNVTEEYAQKIPLAKRLEAIRLILIAEDIVLILKNYKELMDLFKPEPSTQETPANQGENEDGGNTPDTPSTDS